MPRFFAPTEAQRFLRKKGVVETEKWNDLSASEHAHAFTVAHSMKAGILNEIFGLVKNAQAEGESFAEFKKKLLPLMEKKGWYGKRGADKDLSYMNFRAKVIYQTNMRTAQNAGAYRQQLRSAAYLPFLVYKSLEVGNRREAHLTLHNTARAVDDPFWDSYYPPNGWGCACEVVAADQETVNKKGYKPIAEGTPLPKRFVKSVPPEWLHNPGLEAFAPDFSKMEFLQGTEVLKEVKSAYINDLQRIKLSEQEFSTFVRSVAEKDRPLQGLMIPAGIMDQELLTSFEKKKLILDPKLMVTDKQIAHFVRENKAVAQKVTDYGALYRALNHPDEVWEISVKGKKNLRGFQFVSLNKKGLATSAFLHLYEGRLLSFRSAAIIKRIDIKSNAIRKIK